MCIRKLDPLRDREENQETVQWSKESMNVTVTEL